ncbi:MULTISPECIES: hypothetical protein [unclassified Streptomyces]|uniref:hypothetical protein n=1 Tax=unclassified Streptomyces TaxID=2593676 RepID=UPI0033E1A3E0
MWAALGWDSECEGGRWVLRIAYVNGDAPALSTLAVEWPDAAGPPSLLDRYDALAKLGLEVVHGGAEAWAWAEGMSVGGMPLLAGHAEVRPVVPDPDTVVSRS